MRMVHKPAKPAWRVEYEALAQRHKELLEYKDELGRLRPMLHPLIAQAYEAGDPIEDIMELTGLKARESIRSIRAKAGIPGRPGGPRRRTPPEQGGKGK